MSRLSAPVRARVRVISRSISRNIVEHRLFFASRALARVGVNVPCAKREMSVAILALRHRGMVFSPTSRPARAYGVMRAFERLSRGVGGRARAREER